MSRNTLNFIESIFYFFENLIKIPTGPSYRFLMTLPFSLFVIPTIIISIFSKKKEVQKILISLTIIIATVTFLQSNYIGGYINSSENFLKKINIDYLFQSINFLYFMLIIFLITERSLFFKILGIFCTLSIIFFQINSSLIPFYKQKMLKYQNYQNLYTFEGYYSHYDYKIIKDVVKNDRTLSVGLDPMVAVQNDIFVMDGYHSLYPLAYKKKFEKIIIDELNANQNFKNYYQNMGSRIYTSLYFPKNIENFKLNLTEAKSLGAKFIISKFPLNMQSLDLLINGCQNEKLCLYKIN